MRKPHPLPSTSMSRTAPSAPNSLTAPSPHAAVAGTPGQPLNSRRALRSRRSATRNWCTCSALPRPAASSLALRSTCARPWSNTAA